MLGSKSNIRDNWYKLRDDFIVVNAGLKTENSHIKSDNNYVGVYGIDCVTSHHV